MFEKKCNRQLQLKNVDRKASKEEGVGSRQGFGTLSMAELSNTSSNNDSASCKLKPSVPRKNSEALVNPVNQGVHSSAIECDATSADDDEDDGTSDGELASMDKEDDDESNSERSLASKVCTFTTRC